MKERGREKQRARYFSTVRFDAPIRELLESCEPRLFEGSTFKYAAAI